MMEHTPTPWSIDKLPTRICVAGRKGFSGDYRVADAHQSPQLAFTPRHEEAVANAAFIVKAVNSHDELVAALKNVANTYDAKSYREGSQERRLGDLARAALSRAEQP